MSDREQITIAPQPGPQYMLLTCPANEIFFGGARGGGKTYGFALDWIRHDYEFGRAARGIFFRRSYPELEDAIEKFTEMLTPLGAKWLEQKKTFIMPSGATLKMRYLDKDSDAANYQGHAYNWMAFDEAEHWPSRAPIQKIKATLRSAVKGMKLRFLIAANPGGPGHNWLKARYIDPAPPLTPHKDPVTKEWLVYIPSKVTDNILLMANDPGYVDRLRDVGAEWLVQAWLHGNWDIVAGGMFDDVWRNEVHVIEPFLIPPTWTVNRAFDWGSSKPYSVGWWAKSDGSSVKLPDGSEKNYPPGTMFLINELYGWNGQPNEGTKELAVEVGQKVRDIDTSLFANSRDSYERAYPRIRTLPVVLPGPADNAIFDVQNGKSIAADMELRGVRWTRSDKSPGSRKNGWEIMRKMMKAALEFKDGKYVGPKAYLEEPAMFIFSTCRQWLRTVPCLPRDPKLLDDVDTNAEDHAGDMTRYELSENVASSSSEEFPM